ncbi:MAG: phenylacetate--CoA ligase [Alphaproteobacteria bacterium]|nr:phenylacetate--CoA ligase [Alphaproteobacteria bacterium]
MSKDDYYDNLEIRAPEEREKVLAAALADQIADAKANAPFYGRLLAGIDAAAVRSRADLSKLPVTRKSDLHRFQREAMPFGGLVAAPRERIARVFQSPGPVYEPETHRGDFFRFARSLFAAGVRKGELIHNTFSYHLTPAGRMVEAAAHALGCVVIPAGVGNTELQVAVIGDLKPTAYGGTPSFLRILLEKAREGGIDASSLTKAVVGGEALPPSLRKAINDLGVFVLQGYGTADLGLVAYESKAMEGMIVEEGVLVEIVHPGSGEPVAEGEVGEVVVTTFNPDYPLIRFATGDLSAVLPGISPCGRTNMRIKGWMGRADQTTKVKGMFVMPTQVGAVVARHPEIKKARLVVSGETGNDVMTLRCEVEGQQAGLAAKIAESIHAVCKLRGQVEFVAPGSLPNDGKAIEDVRSYK